MSRAFVRESDVPQLPELPPTPSPLPPGAKNYLTAGGAERLRAELARLRDDERPRLVRATGAGASAAKSADDLDAKRELQVLDQRIRYLQESLRIAEIVAPPAGPATVVHFGATVTVHDGREEARYRIVGVDETDLARGWVSWLSPLARALLNAKLGDRVRFKAPSGEKQLEVRAIDYEV